MAEISVIMPVYNAEKTLEQSVNSLLAQSFTSFELILVNDGSKDDSAMLCEKFAKADIRVLVVNKNNGGVQTAVISGINKATGKYCAFVDSDDTARADFLENMYNAIENSSADIVCCGYTEATKIEEKIAWQPKEEKAYNKKEIESEILDFFEKTADLTSFCSGARWNKIYKTQLLQQVAPKLNEEQTMGEDIVMNLYALQLCEKVLLIPYVGYCYNLTDNSAVRSMSYKKYEKYKLMFEEFYTFAKQSNYSPLSLQPRQNRLFSVLVLQTLMSKIPFTEKCLVLYALRADITDKNILRKFANTQPIHGKIFIKAIANGMIITPAFLATANQFVRGQN